MTSQDPEIYSGSELLEREEKKESKVPSSEPSSQIPRDHVDPGPGESASRMTLHVVYDSADAEIDFEKQKEDEEIEDIPDGGKAWWVVLAVFLLNAGTWGANSGFAVYLNYDLTNDVFDGATKIDYALIGGIAFGLVMCLAPFINYLQGILGTRNTIIVGNCFQFAGVFMASYAKSLWQLYVTQGFLNSAGLALITLPSLTLLPQWFKKRRVFAGGLSTSGSGVGGIIFNLGMQKVIGARSVWWALRAQSIICFGIIWVAIFLIKTRIEKKVEFTIFDVNVARCAAYYILVLFVITCMFGYVVVLYTIVNFTVSLGYSSYQGSICAAMIQLGSFVGRPFVGVLSDRIGPFTVGTGVYGLCAIFTLAMWIPARNYATVLIYSLILGSLMGSVYGIIPAMVARVFGLRKMNVAFCMIWVFLAVAGMFSPVIGIKLTSNTQGPEQYINTIIFSGVSFAVCALCLLLLRGYVLARDKLAGEDSDPDLGQLKYSVPFHQPFLNVFKWKKA